MAPKNNKSTAMPAATTSAVKPNATGRPHKTTNKASTSNVPAVQQQQPRFATRSMVLGDPACLVDVRSDSMPHKCLEPQKEQAVTHTGSIPDSAPEEAQQLENKERSGENRVSLLANDTANDERAIDDVLLCETNEAPDTLAESKDSHSAFISRARVESEDEVETILSRVQCPLRAPAPVEEDLPSALPLELWFDIVECLPKREVAIVSRLCKTLEYFCRPLVYKEIIHPGRYKMKPRNAQFLFVQLIRRPEIASLVRVLNGDDINMPVKCIDLFFCALSGMHNLEVLCLGFDMPDDHLEITFPKLEALDIYCHDGGLILDVGPGDELKFLRCSYDVARHIINDPASRHLAKDALLQVHVTQMRATEGSQEMFFFALSDTPHPPGTIELDRFTLRQLATSAQRAPPSQNSIQHLRTHIDSSGKVANPGEPHPSGRSVKDI